MTQLKKQDIIKILTLIRANYDNAYANTDEAEAELLVNFWFDCLNKYSCETVYEATKNAITSSQYVPRLANIVEEAENLTKLNNKSDEQLWAELTESLPKVYEYSRYLTYPQHFNWANAKINEIYEGLNFDLKLFVVNASTLVELASLTAESLTYEKARFFKQMPVLRKHSSDKENASRFLDAVQNKPLLSNKKTDDK